MHWLVVFLAVALPLRGWCMSCPNAIRMLKAQIIKKTPRVQVNGLIGPGPGVTPWGFG